MRTVEQFVQQHPDSANGHENLAEVLVANGRLPEAQAEFDKAAILDPRDFQAPSGKEIVALLQERWADAEAINKQFAESPDTFPRWLALTNSADISLARGQAADALAKFDCAARLSGISRNFRVFAALAHADTLAAIGKPGLAASEIEGVLPDTHGRGVEFQALALLAPD